MSEDIVAEYLAGNPVRANSRELVKEIAENRKLSETKIRNYLIKSGVYISMPRDKSKIEPSDYDGIIERFSQFQGVEGDSYFGPGDLITAVSNDFGYGKWTLENFYREWRKLERPSNVRQFNLARQRHDEEGRIAYVDEINRRIEEKSGGGIQQTRGGPDALGWIFLIVISLLAATCVMNFNADSRKSDLQKKTDKVCEVLGGCR